MTSSTARSRSMPKSLRTRRSFGDSTRVRASWRGTSGAAAVRAPPGASPGAGLGSGSLLRDEGSSRRCARLQGVVATGAHAGGGWVAARLGRRGRVDGGCTGPQRDSAGRGARAVPCVRGDVRGRPSRRASAGGRGRACGGAAAVRLATQWRGARSARGGGGERRREDAHRIALPQRARRVREGEHRNRCIRTRILEQPANRLRGS